MKLAWICFEHDEEYRDKSVIKIDINEPEKAAKVIYG